MLYLNQWLVYTQIYTVTPKILDRLSNIFRYTPDTGLPYGLAVFTKELQREIET